jgi:hypothetical protein
MSTIAEQVAPQRVRPKNAERYEAFFAGRILDADEALPALLRRLCRYWEDAGGDVAVWQGTRLAALLRDVGRGAPETTYLPEMEG